MIRKASSMRAHSRHSELRRAWTASRLTGCLPYPDSNTLIEGLPARNPERPDPRS